MYVCFIAVILSGGDSNNPDFRGFLIQGRTMDNDATGTFVDNGDDQRILCDNVSTQHTYVCTFSAANKIHWSGYIVNSKFSCDY